ncbi:Unknown protein sequence [Pseudomonas amygdali pv. lachrymans]|uniref:Uncharacterized protein n=1 Tax=Pseudomonas amygdali pv. lachrymans TaxID=53707 RepID=A0ABR5KRF8_PSEAV|nr:Unknown protein sequence [Pseudomonas amygdali pv. lachrymans]
MIGEQRLVLNDKAEQNKMPGAFLALNYLQNHEASFCCCVSD